MFFLLELFRLCGHVHQLVPSSLPSVVLLEVVGGGHVALLSWRCAFIGQIECVPETRSPVSETRGCMSVQLLGTDSGAPRHRISWSNRVVAHLQGLPDESAHVDE
jgi:hypothetical protein